MLTEKVLDSWKTLKTETVFSALPWIEVYKDEICLPSGRVVDDFYRVKLPDFVLIYATDKAGNVLVQSSYRHGIGKNAFSLPSGCIEADELPIMAAKRELCEETGFVANRWIHIFSVPIDLNKGVSNVHVFNATGLDKVCEPEENDMEQLTCCFMQPLDLVRIFVSNKQPISIACIAALAVMQNQTIVEIMLDKRR